jgi:opacity protein-like surface antigen
MNRTVRFLVLFVACAVAGVPTPSAAQQRSLLFGIYGGGYDHLRDLHGPEGTSDFDIGHSFGATAGIQWSNYLGLHADFTYATSRARGQMSFAGREFQRYFYSAHVEGRYPMFGGVTPYGFLGAGVLSIHEQGANATMQPFTTPAAVAGLGIDLSLPKSPVSLVGEVKNLFYKWTGADMNVAQVDFDYTVGLTYRLGW